MKLIPAICLLTASLRAVEGHKGLRSQNTETNTESFGRLVSTQGFVRALAFKYTLRVCNSYAAKNKLEVGKGKDKLIDSLPYKECKDLNTDLKGGDKIEFKFDGNEAGTFSIGDLPQNDATLLLMIARHDATSSAVAFESHVFANLANSQVAILDLYRGAEKSMIKIEDKADAKLSRSEDLRYDSVVAVNPGKYDCVLVGSDGKEKSRKGLKAVPQESYVVFRTGVESPDKDDKDFAEDIVVYPKPPVVKKSGTSGASLMAVLLALGVTMLQ